MVKRIIPIKDKTRTYPVDKIDCFEKPISMVFEEVSDYLGTFFIIYSKLFKTYNVNKEVSYNDYFSNISKEKFGIEILFEPIDNDLHSKIKQNIDRNSFTLVPGNLKELYYSEHYKINDWPHLFLINGYDEQKDIYYILDAIQLKKDNEKYREFVIQKNCLINMFDSYSMINNEKYIISYNITDKFYEINKHNILINCLEILRKGIVNKAFMELNIIDDIKNSINDKIIFDELIKNLINTCKYKEVLLNEICDLLKKFSYPEEEIASIKNDKDILIEKWFLFNNKTIKNLYNETIEIDEKKLDEIINLENNLKYHIDICIDFLKFISLEQDSNVTASRLKVENNNDSIISMYNNDIIEFKFANNKVYDSWISDDSPKVIMDAVNKNFVLSTDIEVVTKTFEEGFEAGLFFRTSDGKMYTWTIDYNNKTNLNLIGIKSIEQNFYDNNGIFIEVNNDSVILGINKNKQKIVTSKISIEGDIIQVGLLCKTWGNCKKLDVRFLNYEIINK